MLLATSPAPIPSPRRGGPTRAKREPGGGRGQGARTYPNRALAHQHRSGSVFAGAPAQRPPPGSGYARVRPPLRGEGKEGRS
ncbi:MAG: hypothetical protein K0S06_3731 [Microvirga sp.]|jgi:hypothetical protein|nr:hypothetical protein [Microvirga sp.]